MRDDSKRYPHDAPVETEGMGGAGGGDVDDVGDVGFPRRAGKRDLIDARADSDGMGGAGGGDLDDLGTSDEINSAGYYPTGTGQDIEIAREIGGGSLDLPPEYPTDDLDAEDAAAIGRAGRETIGGETGVVTGITTGVDTDDDTEGPGSPWENLDDGLRESDARGTDTPTD